MTSIANPLHIIKEIVVVFFKVKLGGCSEENSPVLSIKQMVTMARTATEQANLKKLMFLAVVNVKM